jgi:putative component of membrane protein insertase Oxa1/YidC/SpoIIIJ protein YidD
MTLALPIRDGIVRTICTAIEAYRKRISPHKGFSCAYRVKHGRCSCSAFGLRAVKRSLMWFPLLIWRRLRKCAKAAESAKPPVLDYEAKKREAEKRFDGCNFSAADCGSGGWRFAFEVVLKWAARGRLSCFHPASAAESDII